MGTHAGREHQNHLLNGFGKEPPPVEIDTLTGSDLYIERLYPDDILLMLERVKLHEETEDMNPVRIVAEQGILKVMMEFFEKGEEFPLHSDEELKAFVKGYLKQEIEQKLGARATDVVLVDAQIEQVLRDVRGFPPYRHIEPEDELHERDIELLASVGAIDTTDLPQAA